MTLKEENKQLRKLIDKILTGKSCRLQADFTARKDAWIDEYYRIIEGGKKWKKKQNKKCY